MSEKQCSACNWCFPICCCTADQLHIPLAILSVLMVLSAFGSVSDLGDNSEEWGYYGTGAEIITWILSILNIIAPWTFFVSLFDCIKPSIKRILVFIFFIYLVIDAILIGILAIIFVVLGATLNTADCNAYFDDSYDSTTNQGDYSGLCGIIGTLFYIVAIMTMLVCLMHVNWAGATWYYYCNHMIVNVSDNRLLAPTSGASINSAPTNGATTSGEANAYTTLGAV